MATSGKAFVGVSLGARAFTRSWVRRALAVLTARHDELLLLMADDLWLYTRAAIQERDAIRLDFGGARERLSRRCSETVGFLESEVHRLPDEFAKRVTIRRWADYSDHVYARLLRCIRAAAVTISPFQIAVEHAASAHVMKWPNGTPPRFLLPASVDYLIDEIAMCLRVTELAGYTCEYYPGPEMGPVTELYRGAYSEYGLTVASLTGQDPQRQFRELTLADDSQTDAKDESF